MTGQQAEETGDFLTLRTLEPHLHFYIKIRHNTNSQAEKHGIELLASSRGQFSLSYSNFSSSFQYDQPYTFINMFMEETVATGFEPTGVNSITFVFFSYSYSCGAQLVCSVLPFITNLSISHIVLQITGSCSKLHFPKMGVIIFPIPCGFLTM